MVRFPTTVRDTVGRRLHDRQSSEPRLSETLPVKSSIPDGAIGIFRGPNPSSRIMSLGLTQRLTEMNSGNISWG